MENESKDIYIHHCDIVFRKDEGGSDYSVIQLHWSYGLEGNVNLLEREVRGDWAAVQLEAEIMMTQGKQHPSPRRAGRRFYPPF